MCYIFRIQLIVNGLSCYIGYSVDSQRLKPEQVAFVTFFLDSAVDISLAISSPFDYKHARC
jgi:hypothetical protein